MSDSPKADAFFDGGFQVPWGWDPNRIGGTESIKQNLVSTNGAAYSAMFGVAALQQRSGAPFYEVVRHGGIDYATRPGVFRKISDPDDYHFLFTAGWINTPHGSGVPCELNLLSYIRQEASFTSGGRLDDIPAEAAALGGDAAVAEAAEVTRSRCPHCQAEDAAKAEAEAAQGVAVDAAAGEE